MKYWLNILLSLVSVCVAAQVDTISVQQEDFLITAVSEPPYFDEQTNRRVFFDKDTSDCFEEFNERYGKWMENSLVTFWAVPPSLKRSSKKYADLICERLSEINYGNQYLITTILIDENGKPYCCSLSSQESLEGEDRHAILDLLKSLRFNPANNGKRNVKSYYRFSPRKNKKNGRWFYPESTNWEKERRHDKS